VSATDPSDLDQRPVVVVVPCFNEAARLDVQAFERFMASAPGVRLLFVDDGSTDETARVLERLVERAPRAASMLSLARNSGKGEAVRQGLLRAFDEGAAYSGYWDADLATPLHDIPLFHSLLEERPGLDMVMGARVLLMGRDIERKAWRHYLGRVFATAVSMKLGFAVYDTQCGAKLFRVNDRVRRAFAEPFVSRWIFDVEVLARLTEGAEDPDALVNSVPLQSWRDVAGTKLSWRDFVQAAVDLARM